MGSKNAVFSMNSFIGKKVKVEIRLYGRYLEGTLRSFDRYSNVALENIVEYNRTEVGKYEKDAEYSEALVRGDSIVNISLME